MRGRLAFTIACLALLVYAAPAEAAEGPTRRTWPSYWTGNQGPHPTCVAYAWLTLLTTEPFGLAEPPMRPSELFETMQRDDGGYEPGTTLDAGARALEADGYIGGWRWAASFDEVVAWVLGAGPVVVVSPTPWSEERHAYVIDGVNLRRGTVRIHNDRGVRWGRNGRRTYLITEIEQLYVDGAGNAILAWVP